MSLKNPVTPQGIDPGTFRLVAQRLNHYATPDPVNIKYLLFLADLNKTDFIDRFSKIVLNIYECLSIGSPVVPSRQRNR